MDSGIAIVAVMSLEEEGFSTLAQLIVAGEVLAAAFHHQYRGSPIA